MKVQRVIWKAGIGAGVLLGTAGMAMAQANNNCANATPISGEGFFAFNNSSATTDGPTDPACNAFGSSQVEHDVWFCWTCPADGYATVSTCGGTGVDTKIAAYAGCGCPATGALACNDDACNFQSQIQFDVVAGQTYMVRIGTFPGASGGTGTFEISIGEPPPPPNEGPDVIVGELSDVAHYGPVGGVHAYSVGTVSCNIGDQDVMWVANTPMHPVIGQNLYRLANGRFEQLGLSWLKHGFTALTGNLCGVCNGHGGSVLGVGCSDPYGSFLNGDQGGLGPRFQVNATTGVFAYPWSNPAGSTGNAIFKRIQVSQADLQTPDAMYFVEGQYVTQDDAQANNGRNNASYRRVTVGTGFTLTPGGATHQQSPAIQAWKDNDPDVDLQPIDYEESGITARFWLGAKVTDLGDGTWAYEYAIQNLNSHRSGGSFTVPAADSVDVTGLGFHDVSYHSGEPFDGTDWSASHSGGQVTWSTAQTYQQNQNANALRWGTLYNFRFIANTPPTAGDVTIGLFRPGAIGEPNEVTATTMVPSTPPPSCACDWNGDLLLTSQDFFDFLDAFFSGSADYNDDGLTTSQDFFDFLDCFFTGC